ncbi:MAG: ammonia monooxygenase [Rhodospirillales bacterium CG15_BIG_FIL_POST_REV_8_21_14_020_66_15]|nr:MAG: ammonia monooxygenase [Rhodospirillales bacterium CG15_BIG_FIL_POST_REV_8_21_14_020_66_15]
MSPADKAPTPDAAAEPDPDESEDDPENAGPGPETEGNPKTRPLRMALTLALGGVGGSLFHELHMPLPWMIGGLVFTLIASLSGAPLVRPKRLRIFMVPVLGVMLGAGFTPEAIGHAAEWLASLAMLLVYALGVTAMVSYYLVKVARWDAATSYFSASPGGFGEMALLGEAMGADDRKISLNHSVRIMLTVLIIPFWFKFFEGYEPGNMMALGTMTDVRPKDAAILIACAVVGYYVARRLRFPAAQLLGPTLVSAVVHMAGLTEARPPQEIVALAQVVIGAAIGCRFLGISLRQVFGTMAQAAAITAFMLGAALGGAWIVSQFTGLPVKTLWLAFAPGGLAEMTLISLSLGIDVAFVSVHHMVRVIFLVSMAPIAFKVLEGILKRAEAVNRA